MDRCSNCKKKSHVIFKCTCCALFCVKCKTPEDHKCSFDYKAAHRELLEKKNLGMKGMKVESI